VQSGVTSLSVNLPSLNPGQSAHSQRIAHIHQNTPGVLAHLNRVFAEHDVNVDGQILATRGHLGYVVTDTGSHLSSDVVERLRAVPETIRLRVID
jgi:D-3-phosphoglycerate dehydrogenase / 2-oxoglutarate reductase